MFNNQQPSRNQDLNEILQRAKVQNQGLAREDITKALKTFTDLRPTLVNHLFPDGQTRFCCSLAGTIPVRYKGNTYNIPVALYFLDNHPYTGPFCYVRPTATMRIRVSPSVDEKGRVYLPYLTDWRYPGYETSGLLQMMTMAFQDKCPVYSVSSSHTNPVPNPTTPYPMAASGGATPYPSANSGSHLPTPYPPSGASGSTSVAPYPTAGPMSMPMPNAYATPQPNAAYQPPYQPYMNLPNAGSRSSLNSNQSSDVSQQQRSSAGNATTWDGYGAGTIQSSHIKASLISAIEDKIRNRLRDKIGTPFAELQSVNINLQELQTGQQKLKGILERIDQEQKQLDIILVTYLEKKIELEKALESCIGASNGGGSPSIDDAIDASTPLHRQIVRCYVQDCAIDDTIYFLGQALKKDTINLQTYLKYVRQLSRKQFIHRATIQKCRQKARLPI